MSNNLIKIEGTIEKIPAANDNHYLRVTVIPKDGSAKVTAVGVMPNAVEGAKVILYGTWQEYVFKTGQKQQQFKVSKFEIAEIDRTAVALTKFFSDYLKGAGTKLAITMVDTLGTSPDSYMLDASKLIRVKGISEKRAQTFIEDYKTARQYLPVYELTGGEVTKLQAEKIFLKYGSKTEKILRRNPYILIYEIKGFGFSIADKIALGSGLKTDSPERIEAGIVCSLRTASQNDGHAFMFEQDLIEQTQAFLMPVKNMKYIFYTDVLQTEVPSDTSEWYGSSLAELLTNHSRIVENMLKKWEQDDRSAMLMYEKKYLLSSDDMETLAAFSNARNDLKRKIRDVLNKKSVYLDGHPLVKKLSSERDVMDVLFEKENIDKYIVADVNEHGLHRYYERKNYLSEEYIAETIATMLNKPVSIPIEEDFIRQKISEFEVFSNTTLGHEQKLAVETSLLNRVSIITGGPGRGKTMIEKVIISIWKASGGAVLLLAPTGRAAQRMAESTGVSASTIHRVLNWKNAPALSNHTREGNKTLVIVDEASMLDMNLATRLLHTFTENHILFIGDADQLPCVGVGTVFEDLIKSGKVPFTVLEECYRNAGSISQNSDLINRGARLKDLQTDHMFKTWFCKEPEEIADNILTLYKRALQNYTAKDISVIVPLRQNRKTSANELNKRIQEECNPKAPGKNEVRVGYNLFREGDRCIQTKNNYQLMGMKNGKPVEGVFNGECGTIASIRNGSAEVLFDDGKRVFYNTLDMNQLSLAYATTVHKSQGAEYPVVIVGISQGDYLLLCRKILYTAVSRGKKIDYLVGDPVAIQKCISNSYYETRNTSLASRIISIA